MSQHTFKLQLTENQKRRLRIAYKKQKLVVLSFNKDQLKNGDIEVLLTDEQYRQVQKALRKNTGVRLILDYRQLKDNIDGGLLKEILSLAENNIPYFKKIASPLIKDKLAPMMKNQFVPWLKKLVDEELDELMEKDPTGAGLRRYINNELNSVFSQVKKK